jgi:putative copper resistance protein D
MAVTALSIAEVAVRAMTYVAALLMFGASVFAVYAPLRARGDTQDDDGRERRALRRTVRQLQLGSAAAALVSGLACLVVHSAVVAGVPVLQAASGAVAGEMLRATLFGRALALHLGLAVALIGAVAVERGEVDAPSSRSGDLFRAVLAAAMLGTFAWMGHAAATRGADHYVHLGSDVVHLLAAGAWLGALPLLAATLVRSAQRRSPTLDRIALATTARFSAVGAICVAALVTTGTINAWYLVATPAALFGTSYGQLLLLKLALLASMLALAARNRFVLMPRIEEAAREGAEAGRVAMRRLARSAWIEGGFGVAIVVIVGVLGISVPGAHSGMTWPMPVTPEPRMHMH